MTGRFSKYPKVDRSRPAWPATAAERLADARNEVQATPTAVTVAVASEADTGDVPDVSSMTVAEVLAWVGDDDDRAAVAVAAERAGRNRRGIMDALAG